jgi:hypothetical protein
MEKLERTLAQWKEQKYQVPSFASSSGRFESFKQHHGFHIFQEARVTNPLTWELSTAAGEPALAAAPSPLPESMESFH